MSLSAPPKEKITLFSHIEIRNGYVGVLRPIKEEDSDIEIPETATKKESMENVTVRVARVGPEVEGLEPGDKVLASLYMQQPHQIVQAEDEDGEEFHMFIIDSDMIVGIVHDQREQVDEIFNG